MIDSCRQIIDQLSKMAAGVGVFCSSHSLRLIVLVAIASCRTEEVLNGRELATDDCLSSTATPIILLV